MSLSMIEFFNLLFSAQLSEIETCIYAHPACLKSKGPSGQSALWFAVETGREDVVKLLLDSGVDPNEPVTYNPPVGKGGVTMTPLMNAKTIPVLVTLVDSGARMDALDSTGRSVMYHLSAMGDPGLIVKGLELGGAFQESEVDRIRSSFTRELKLRLGYSNRSPASDQRCQSLRQVLDLLN